MFLNKYIKVSFVSSSSFKIFVGTSFNSNIFLYKSNGVDVGESIVKSLYVQGLVVLISSSYTGYFSLIFFLISLRI